jgi:hypothetical protein
MGNDLKKLVETLVRNDDSDFLSTVAPSTEVVESNSEEAWNDFQDSQEAFEKAFKDPQRGSL